MGGHLRTGAGDGAREWRMVAVFKYSVIYGLSFRVLRKEMAESSAGVFNSETWENSLWSVG